MRTAPCALHPARLCLELGFGGGGPESRWVCLPFTAQPVRHRLTLTAQGGGGGWAQ